MKILHFGAGKIGRGLVYPYFRQRHDITLLDRNQDLVQAIRDNNGYRVIELDQNGQTIRNIISPQIMSFSELAEVYDIDVITTSVLVSNLPAIAPYIGEIAKRNKKRLYIIPMENSLDAVGILKRELDGRLHLRGDTFFLGSVIDRIVPSITNRLDIECEKYCSIKIENRSGIEEVAGENALLTDNIQKEFDKKFLLVNGVHACAAYLGYRQGHEYICDVLADTITRARLHLIGECYIQYLIAVHGYREEELASYFKNTLDRFSNRLIKDPLSRVGRNLLLKLSPTDRIVRPLLFNKSHGLDYQPLEEVVHAAEHFTVANDYEEYVSQSRELKRRAVAG